jgi:hypothetical protein
MGGRASSLSPAASCCLAHDGLARKASSSEAVTFLLDVHTLDRCCRSIMLCIVVACEERKRRAELKATVN